MIAIIGIVAFLAVLALSLVITRIATVALIMTGLSREAARFQARSAFTGTGFTTAEAEQVVGHPVRRWIVMVLMVVRSAGIVTILISLILSFGATRDGPHRLALLGWLAGGTVVLFALAHSRLVDRVLSRPVSWALKRWTDLDVRDYAGLLHLHGAYSVLEIRIRKGDWLAGKTLRNCFLRAEGANVLGIVRADGSYIGVPTGDTEVYAGDTLIVYGRTQSLKELDRRRGGMAGDAAHERAIDEERGRMARQKQQETEQKRRRRSESEGEQPGVEEDQGEDRG